MDEGTNFIGAGGYSMAVEKLLPQNVEAEAGVLGSLLIDPEAVVQVAEFLRPDDFYRDAHRTIFQAVLELYESGEPADLITLTDELQRRGEQPRKRGREGACRPPPHRSQQTTAA